MLTLLLATALADDPRVATPEVTVAHTPGRLADDRRHPGVAFGWTADSALVVVRPDGAIVRHGAGVEELARVPFPVTAAEVSRDATEVLASDGTRVVLVDLGTGTTREVGEASAVPWVPPLWRRLAAASLHPDAVTARWAPAPGPRPRPAHGREGALTARPPPWPMACAPVPAPDAHATACVDGDGGVRVLDATGGFAVDLPDPPSCRAEAVRWTLPDLGLVVATCSGHPTLVVDPRTGTATVLDGELLGVVGHHLVWAEVGAPHPSAVGVAHVRDLATGVDRVLPGAWAAVDGRPLGAHDGAVWGIDTRGEEVRHARLPRSARDPVVAGGDDVLWIAQGGRARWKVDPVVPDRVTRVPHRPVVPFRDRDWTHDVPHTEAWRDDGTLAHRLFVLGGGGWVLLRGDGTLVGHDPDGQVRIRDVLDGRTWPALGPAPWPFSGR